MDRSLAIARSLVRWFHDHARDLPWRRTRDPYAIWVSEIMLQQTTVATVVPYFTRWMHELPDVTALASAPLDRVLKLWEGLGYYRRARLLHRAAQEIVTHHAGRLPERPGDWLALPGIGRYTAGAISSLAFNAPEPVLDGNVIRVLSRLEAIRDDIQLAATREKYWQLATGLVRQAQHVKASRGCGDLNEALMELGATICSPREPACANCPVRRVCRAHALAQVNQFPYRPANEPPSRVKRTAWVLEHDGRYFVERQAAAAHNAGLWQFPQFDAGTPSQDVERLAPIAGQPIAPIEVLGEFGHTITRYRITLTVVRAKVGRPLTPSTGRWCTLAELHRLAMSRAHRRIVDQWLGAAPPRAPRTKRVSIGSQPTARRELTRRSSATRRTPS